MFRPTVLKLLAEGLLRSFSGCGILGDGKVSKFRQASRVCDLVFPSGSSPHHPYFHDCLENRRAVNRSARMTRHYSGRTEVRVGISPATAPIPATIEPGEPSIKIRKVRRAGRKSGQILHDLRRRELVGLPKPRIKGRLASYCSQRDNVSLQ